MYQLTIIIILSIIISFCFVLYLLDNQRYKIKNDSTKEKEAKELYIKDYPGTTIEKLERQIKIVSERLINLQESNRYTWRLVRKAKHSNLIKKLREKEKIEPNLIKIIDYKNKKLKAKVEYKQKGRTYYFIMKMKTVYSGRIFLKQFKIEKI